MYSKKTILKIATFVLTVISVSCSSGEQENDQPEEIDFCSCAELFFDDDYNHFYLNNRTEPFTGKCQETNSGGVVVLEKNFEKGKLTGKYLEFYDNGTPKHEWNFLNNRQHGEQKLFKEDGSLSHHSIYSKGELDSIVFSTYPIIQ
jgi:antitoxin component YwqK of YwqJK toxin-antitoxin module